mmetsp:Transcript_21544/g.61764  ORF Transcript_21544/g.61764 Transcript_21544/m.61764 type:complete len:408 (-) Transcript_21544:72-1295(-)
MNESIRDRSGIQILHHQNGLRHQFPFAQGNRRIVVRSLRKRRGQRKVGNPHVVLVKVHREEGPHHRHGIVRPEPPVDPPSVGQRQSDPGRVGRPRRRFDSHQTQGRGQCLLLFLRGAPGGLFRLPPLVLLPVPLGLPRGLPGPVGLEGLLIFPILLGAEAGFLLPLEALGLDLGDRRTVLPHHGLEVGQEGVGGQIEQLPSLHPQMYLEGIVALAATDIIAATIATDPGPTPRAALDVDQGQKRVRHCSQALRQMLPVGTPNARPEAPHAIPPSAVRSRRHGLQVVQVPDHPRLGQRGAAERGAVRMVRGVEVDEEERAGAADIRRRHVRQGGAVSRRGEGVGWRGRRRGRSSIVGRCREVRSKQRDKVPCRPVRGRRRREAIVRTGGEGVQGEPPEGVGDDLDQEA